VDPPPGSRGLLWTLLGEFVLPSGGEVWTSTLVSGLGALGVEEKAARQAMARSAAHSWLEREKVGRRVRWRLSAAGRDLLIEGTRRIYSFGREGQEWDGRWLLLWVTVPETRRDLRYRLRVRLEWTGFAPIGAGAWLSPWVGREPEAVRALHDLGVHATALSFVGGLGRLGDPSVLVTDAWELELLADQYRTFVDRHHRRSPDTDLEVFVSLAGLVHDWRRFPTLDPELPRQLLPGVWAGDEALETFHLLHDRWTHQAQVFWATQESAGGQT
jgi:phenylacetic acid degradation operon negative regulatory protein